MPLLLQIWFKRTTRGFGNAVSLPAERGCISVPETAVIGNSLRIVSWGLAYDTIRKWGCEAGGVAGGFSNHSGLQESLDELEIEPSIACGRQMVDGTGTGTTLHPFIRIVGQPTWFDSRSGGFRTAWKMRCGLVICTVAVPDLAPINTRRNFERKIESDVV